MDKLKEAKHLKKGCTCLFERVHQQRQFRRGKNRFLALEKSGLACLLVVFFFLFILLGRPKRQRLLFERRRSWRRNQTHRLQIELRAVGAAQGTGLLLLEPIANAL